MTSSFICKALMAAHGFIRTDPPVKDVVCFYGTEVKCYWAAKSGRKAGWFRGSIVQAYKCHDETIFKVVFSQGYDTVTWREFIGYENAGKCTAVAFVSL